MRLLSPGEVCTVDSLVLGLPGHEALCTGHGAAVRAHQLLVLRVRQETEGALVAPLEVGVLGVELMKRMGYLALGSPS